MQVFFDRTLENEFEKIYTKFKSIELKADEAYQADLSYLAKKLQVFEPCASLCDREDFNSAAIDGSGAESLVSLNDISIHLLTAAFAADTTNFGMGTTKKMNISPPVCTHPEGITRLILLREDKKTEVWDEFKDFILYNYKEDLSDVVFRVIKDIVETAYKQKNPDEALPKLDTETSIRMAAVSIGLNLYKDDFNKFSSWMVSPRANAPRGWFEQFREVLEYSVANALLDSKENFKYIFLDGSMNMLMSPGQKQPRLASNYLLRDINLKAIENKTCIVAVSKTTTFPFIYRLAQDLEKSLGMEKKWFIRIPTEKRDTYTLNVLKDRPHIPPAYGVTYLFHFSSEVPVLRIDFDEKWWLENIYSEDITKERENEIEIFQDIDWLARDVRYYGYFFDLAFAHNTTIVRFPERDDVADRLIDYFVEKGENPKMFIHPRKRLGLM
jgi:hypothetical protein